MIGASSRDRHLPEIAEIGRRDADPNTPASEPFIATAKVWTRPISSEATKAPASEPSPPTTMTTNRIGPSERRHGRLGDQRRAGDDAGEAGERGAGAEHEHEDPRHVVAEHRDHVGMRQRRLDDEADPRRASARRTARRTSRPPISSMNMR